eukprot:365206-Chlamydomonas_euryale.AAC.3
MCRGRRSKPVTSSEAEAGLRPRTCLRPRAFACMHVRGRGPADAKAGVIGRDRRRRQACFVQG